MKAIKRKAIIYTFLSVAIFLAWLIIGILTGGMLIMATFLVLIVASITWVIYTAWVDALRTRAIRKEIHNRNKY